MPKIDPKITQKSTSAPQGLPEASGERPRASRKPPGSHFGAILDPFWDNFGPHLGPPGASCISLGALLPSTRSTRLSQAPFEITVQKVFSEPLKARCAIRCWLSGRFGARMRPQEIRPLSLQAQEGAVSEAYRGCQGTPCQNPASKRSLDSPNPSHRPNPLAAGPLPAPPQGSMDCGQKSLKHHIKF